MNEPQTAEHAGEALELDGAAIARLIPHRHPFLFIERARITGADEIEGTALWPADHPILAGHFPQRAIVPGVCQIEALAQLGALLIAHRERGTAAAAAAASAGAAATGVLASVRHASFHCLVGPGQRLILGCQVRKVQARAFLVSGTGRRDGRMALRAEVLIAISEGEPA